jgi:hypothetical protein
MKVDVVFSWQKPGEAGGVRMGPYAYVEIVGCDLLTDEGLLAVCSGGKWHVEGYYHPYTTVRVEPVVEA